MTCARNKVLSLLFILGFILITINYNLNKSYEAMNMRTVGIQDPFSSDFIQILCKNCRNESKIHLNFTITKMKKNLRLKRTSRLNSIHRFCKDPKNAHVVALHRKMSIKRQLFLADAEHLAYCPIPKTGTNTWLSHLARLTDLKQIYFHQGRGKFHKFLNKKLGTFPKNSNLNTSFVFVFTRNPLTRLVSAYNHALVGHNLQRDYKEMNKRIIDFSRENQANVTSKNEKTPEPEEFVRYLINTVDKEGWWNINIHFRPQWMRCPFCTGIFDFVGRQETFLNDAIILNETLKLGIKVQLKSGHISKNKLAFSKFFKNVEKEDLSNLCRIYKEDFEMLGFNNHLEAFEHD